jgi:cyclin-dependent kinase-like
LIQKCLGPLTPQHNEYFLKNPKFIGMKFPEIHTLESIERRYVGKIDKLGIDLLKKMLKMDPSARITA